MSARFVPSLRLPTLGICAALLGMLPAQTLNVYFGNLHSHTAYSDGTGTPEQAYTHARVNGKLDFLLISEHNHAAAEGTGDDPERLHIARDPSLYRGQPAALIDTANRINQAFPNSFVALYGQEFSTNSGGNHANVFDLGEVIDEQIVPNKNYRKLYESWLATHLDSEGRPAIVQFNHPRSVNQDYGILNFQGDMEAVRTAAAPHVRTIEIINGPHDAQDSGNRITSIKSRAYLTYLNHGFRLAPSADQDNHFITHGTATDHRTAVLAPALTKRDLLQAIRDRRVYASQDKNLQIFFSVNGSIMGSVVELASGTPLRIEVRLRDADEPTASYRVSLRRDTVGDDLEATSELDHQDTEGDSTVVFDQFQYTGGEQYYLVQVIQTSDSDEAWTAPVWIVPPGGASGPDTHPPDEGVVRGPSGPTPRFVWSRARPVFHLANCRDARLISEANRETGNTPPAGKRLHDNCPR